MSNDVTVIESGGAIESADSWTGAAARGLAARNERQRIIKSVLVEGEDYGVIPGTGKPALLKSGAEKVADSLNLYAAYEVVQSVENFDKPLFFYRYRCELRQRGTDAVVATGVGSCNSHEAKYRWRSAQRKCPSCGKEAIIKGKAEYGGGWLCFGKKGGCGAKWNDGAEVIESQSIERVENEDICDQVNTIDKMAQKRAIVAAALNLGFSSNFTQDVEDMPGFGVAVEPQAAPVAAKAAPKHTGPKISDAQRKRMWALAKEAWPGEANTEHYLRAVLRDYGFESSTEITKDQYQFICDAIQRGGAPLPGYKEPARVGETDDGIPY